MARGPGKPKAFYKKLWVQVLIGMGIGVVLGHVAPETGAAMKPLGDAFIKLIKMIIAPIIFVTVVSGLSKMSNMKEVGRIGVRAVILFEIVSTLAMIVGLVVGILVQPGAGLNADPATLNAGAVTAQTARSATPPGSVEFFMNIIPETVIGAFATGYILQVLFFSVLFGLALLKLGEKGRPLLNLIDNLSAALFAALALIMTLAPIGTFGAMAFSIGKYGHLRPRSRWRRSWAPSTSPASSSSSWSSARSARIIGFRITEVPRLHQGGDPDRAGHLDLRGGAPAVDDQARTVWAARGASSASSFPPGTRSTRTGRPSTR